MNKPPSSRTEVANGDRRPACRTARLFIIGNSAGRSGIDNAGAPLAHPRPRIALRTSGVTLFLILHFSFCFLHSPLSASPPQISTSTQTRRYTMQDLYEKEKKASFWQRLENNLAFLGGLTLAILLPGSSFRLDSPNVKVSAGN